MQQDVEMVFFLLFGWSSKAWHTTVDTLYFQGFNHLHVSEWLLAGRAGAPSYCPHFVLFPVLCAWEADLYVLHQDLPSLQMLGGCNPWVAPRRWVSEANVFPHSFLWDGHRLLCPLTKGLSSWQAQSVLSFLISGFSFPQRPSASQA